MKYLLILISVVLCDLQLVSAQNREVNSNADLPVTRYATSMLKQGDTAQINTWMKNLAVAQLKHTDSILKNYTIRDSGIWVKLIRTKSLCNFITGNWKELAHANTVFQNMRQAAPIFRKAGIAELASYARAKLEPGTNFVTTYMTFYKQSLEALTLDEKMMFTGFFDNAIRTAPALFELEKSKLKNEAFVGDTAVYGLLKGFVYARFTSLHPSLTAYVDKSIKGKFTRADTLRGSITPERAWWDVLHYDITVKPDFSAKTISGKNVLQYRVVSDSYPAFMQIDLQEPMVIDSIFFNSSRRKLAFTKDGNAWHVAAPKQKKLSIAFVEIFYHGEVREAVNAPWDGGWIWTKDSLNNPWMSAACQGLGASVWYPCKDHQADEPDSGASLTMIVPDTLVAIANGRLQSKQNNSDGTVSYTWAVINPINNYDLIPYIGKYVNFSDVFNGAKGKLDCNYWVLSYNLQRAKEHMVPEVQRMLKAFEFWMGPYPFYEDGYKLIDAPHLGMEHQSAVAYGNQYKNGYLGQDLSSTGWGLKWDYIIVHESGHEWFGNNITTKDMADMWVHEGFTTYSETLFTEYWYGAEAGDQYTFGSRNNIENNFPVLGFYGVNDQIDSRNGDMYPKGANLLHTIRHSIGNDSLFRQIITGLNKTFYHQTVTSLQVENYFSLHAGYDYSKVFNQYLRTTQIPQFEFYFSNDKKRVFYRYTNCIKGFNLPLLLKSGKTTIKLFPGEQWKNIKTGTGQAALFDTQSIIAEYYITAKELAVKN